MKILILNTFLFLGTFMQLSFAQSFDKNKLDQYFNQLEENNKFMGTVAVYKNGNIIYSKSVGYIDVEKKIKANENSKYRIGSISKTFTAVLVFIAIEEQKLTLSQTIDTFFPEIKNAKKITIRQLLKHRSGINDFTKDKDYRTWKNSYKTQEEIIDVIVKKESEFEPGSKTRYSNSNYVVLSYILEKIYNKTYAELLKSKITEPLGLLNTRMGEKINTENNECNSYHFAQKWELVPETNMSIPIGAGGVVSSPKDLAVFGNALFDGKLLQPGSLELMVPLKSKVGLGLFRIPFYKKTGYGHGGKIDGFSSALYYFPDDSLSYALISNGIDYSSNDVSITVLNAIYDMPYELPEFGKYEVDSLELDSYIGVYSSKELPLKITVSKGNKSLRAQATGQSAFTLEATRKDKFAFYKAGIVMEFNPQKNTMTLKQAGKTYIFEKE